MTISFRALEIPASELAEKPLGQPSAEPLTGEILTRAQVFLDTKPLRRELGNVSQVHRGGSSPHAEK
jgi:hypothetical protein